ncbi:uncharacterized protein LOC108906244 [Anoplophora glabripennis]|uniref:uncharacterized protein LOC108906244 n=1 Tax=Anoplophora glabripennis TaxID=217634 RepID=UPI000874E530|nr:uncharacterized protein LOC108906244 [Anoplophora glabripennis]
MNHIFFIILCVVVCIQSEPVIISSDIPNSNTIVTAKNVTLPKIEYKIVNKPHHLFIGRCSSKHRVLHQENIILTNDGKSHVSATIRMNVEGPVYITCVNIFDEIPNGEGGYPSFAAGGVGHNFIEFNVLTNYGKGFHFFVQIFGYTKKDNGKNNY